MSTPRESDNACYLQDGASGEPIADTHPLSAFEMTCRRPSHPGGKQKRWVEVICVQIRPLQQALFAGEHGWKHFPAQSAATQTLEQHSPSQQSTFRPAGSSASQVARAPPQVASRQVQVLPAQPHCPEMQSASAKHPSPSACP